MPLTTLDLHGCGQITDLSPLKGMQLTMLYLIGCGQVHDVTPLKGMSLTEVHLTPQNITKGMNLFRQMKSLKTIGIGVDGNSTVAEFWKKYDAGEFNK